MRSRPASSIAWLVGVGVLSVFAGPSVAWSQPSAPAAAGTGGAASSPAAAGGTGAAASAALPTTAPAPTTTPTTPPKLKNNAPPPPAPSAAQLRALGILQQEAKEYEKGAKHFRDTLTMIVRHHYEERRRRILTALDREIGIEKAGLRDARAEAIKRLEKFIAIYSGDNAHPVATPDAMFRLAALYEERARESQDADIATGLDPAINLYRRIITEYPNYEETAAVHYFLGHAYTDSARLEEGQQAWRVLVCSNKFQVKTDPADTGKIEVQALPQDHDDKFWNDWYNKHPIPMDQIGKLGAKAPKPKAGKAAPMGTDEEELSYKNPYGECTPLPQNLKPGEEPRYLAEIWWQLGNFHFDQIDPKGGPYNLNRAVSAYDRSLEYKKPPLYGVSMYKQAWAYFKQQRYRTATDWFVKLLHYADEQEAKTGDPGADFRQEAFTYIAGSLTYVDFDGPPAQDPYIARNDVLDLESDPIIAEQKMAIAIDRVQDPQLIPQDKKWTVEIYKALAQEFIEITQNRNAIRTLEITLQKFPMDRDAPVMQNKVAELYDQLSRLAPEGSDAKAEYGAKALKARTMLAQYVGTTPWTDANKDDPEALAQAEALVKGGLKRAAADHTNAARNLYNQASERSDPGEQKVLIDKSIEEYKLAETGWAAYIAQDPNALDAYESKFWLADARYWVVVLQVTINRTPTAAEIASAREAAIAVRDSNEDDKYLQPAAYYVVTMADKVLEDNHRQFEESKGSRGIEKRDAVERASEAADAPVVKVPVPQPVLDTITARDEYNARIAPERDPKQNGTLYAFQAADNYYVYGQFEQARPRFKTLYDQYCGKNEWGYKAWERLIDMAALERDAKATTALAKGKSCAYSEETKVAEEAKRKPVMQTAAYQDAAELFEKAQKMPDGPERQKTWRQAAAAYKVALDAAPDRDEAPEAAMNGAYAYKQVGEYDKAIEMYELFISKYGSEKLLQTLKNGDPKAKPPVAARPKEYEKRVGYLKTAYDALAGSYVLFFDYPKAATTFDKISSIEHFAPDGRREAAKQAMSLYASLGDRGGMSKARNRFKDMGASPKEIAEADFIIASSDLKKWDEYSPDTGANQNARKNAQTAMSNYYAANKGNGAAAQWVVHAAYHTAKMKHASNQGDTNKWWQSTIDAYDKYKQVAPTKDGKSSAIGSREASMAAQGAYTMVDEDLERQWDYGNSAKHKYKGTAVKVIGDYRKNALEAKKWYDKLQAINDKYVSPEWTTVSIARQGTVYDSLRTGLYNTRPPELVMFDKKTEALLKKAENSDNPDLQEKADAVRIKVQTAWRDARDKEIDSADGIVVDRYGNAIVLARRYSVSNPGVTHAIRRLAFLTDVIGEAKMKQHAAGVKDLNYTDGMFLRMRPGQVTSPEPEGMPRPLPVISQ